MKERSFVIDDAPGKEFIPSVKTHADVDAFKEFYRQRRDWWGYPLIHDQLVTYGIFDDLMVDLDTKIKTLLLPHALQLAVEETDKRFLCSVFFVLNLMDGFRLSDDQDNIRTKLVELLPRAKKLSIFPNMSSFWNPIIRRVFIGNESKAMLVNDNDWLEFTPLDLPAVDDCGWENCPGGEERIREEISTIGGGEFELEFKRNALYGDSKYWIWLYKNVSTNPIWHFYVFVVLTPDGKSELKRHAMSTVNMSPEELIVKHSYDLIR